jgi:hypothetical protein
MARGPRAFPMKASAPPPFCLRVSASVEILDNTIGPTFENEAVTIDHRYAISGLVGERGWHYVQRKSLTDGKGANLTDGKGPLVRETRPGPY